MAGAVVVVPVAAGVAVLSAVPQAVSRSETRSKQASPQALALEYLVDFITQNVLSCFYYSLKSEGLRGKNSGVRNQDSEEIGQSLLPGRYGSVH